MATAYYHAAHFTMPVVLPTAFSNSTPTLSLDEAPSKDTPSSHNHFICAAQRHFLRARYMDEQQDSIFFRLPAELRQEVYKEVLCAGTPRNVKELARCSSRAGKPPSPIHPAILSTCRKIHDEAADLLYTTHVFHAHPSLLTALPHLTCAAKPVVCPSALARITRWQLTVRLDTDPRFTWAQAAAAFSGAEYLDIRVWQSMFDGCDESVLRLFTGVRGVKVARVGGSADPALASWLEKRMMRPFEEKDDREVCRCEEEIRCGQCGKKASLGSEWFGGRDAWTFGNR